MKAVEPQRNTGERFVTPADPAILKRIRGCPFARGGRVLVRFRADGYSLVARRSGVPLARLRLTGEGDEVVLLYPSYRAWEVLTAGALRPWPPRAASSSEPQVRTSRARYQTTVTVWLTLHLRLPHRTRMPRTKAFAANAGSADLNAMIERVAPDILKLLA